MSLFFNRTELLQSALGYNRRWGSCRTHMPTERQREAADALLKKWEEEDKWKVLERCWVE